MTVRLPRPGGTPKYGDPAVEKSPMKKSDDDQLEVAEEDSFPASDPPSITDPMKTVDRPE